MNPFQNESLDEEQASEEFIPLLPLNTTHPPKNISKMVRPLQHLKDTPRQALNFRLFYAIAAIGLLGISRGGDEGTVGSMTSSEAWKNAFHVEEGSSQQSNVVSMVQLGNIPGSLLTFILVDKIGRIRSIQACCLIWILGTAIWITSNGNLGQTLGGRFIAGIGIGGFPVVCPTFLAEIAPRTVRGLAMSIYSASVYIGIVIGYGANLGSNTNFNPLDDKVWKVPVSINFIYAGLFFFASFFVRESPRAMAKKGETEKAWETLSWYRNMPRDHPYVRDEMEGILDEVHREAQAKHGKNIITLFKELLTKSRNLYKLIVIGFGIQILGQWSGGGSLTIYAQKIFTLVGVESNASLYTTCIFGVVKLLSALACSFFLIDILGRKRSVFIGIGLQTLAALYLCIYVASLGDVNKKNNTNESPGQERASIGAIVMVFVSGVGWAMGFNSIQYIIGTEIWQIELRAVATSLIMAIHFANQYGSSRALQPMLIGMHQWGLFAFWTVIGVLAALYIFLLIPETSGVSLEDMDRLFERRWWQIGMLSNRPATGDMHARVAIPESGLSNMPDMLQNDKEINEKTEKKDATHHNITDA